MITIASLAHLPAPLQVQALTLRAWIEELYTQLRAAEADYAAAHTDTPAQRSAEQRAQRIAAEIAAAQRRLPPLTPDQH